MTFDRVTLQLVGSSLLYASEEMGLALRDSSYSPNIKERMDHSAAIFDGRGRLLAQAEHIPVHLGSLPWGLVNLLRHSSRVGPALGEGTMVVANDPYITGTHLNDVTVAAPVFHRGVPIAYVANKAHHADIGGAAPGSISMLARTLQDEGTVLEPALLWQENRFVDSTLEGFASASRTPAERRGDLRAQVAANITGMRRVMKTVEKYGIEAFREAGANSIAHSEALARRRISRLRPGTYRATDFVEGIGGAELRIRVKVAVSSSTIKVDYEGSSAEVDYPLNSVFGVTLSGVYFVARCLLGSDIPANHGAFSALTVQAPKGTIVNPSYPHPVGGGNVETSQRNADVLFRALSGSAPRAIPAAAGGSMNNVMMGGGEAPRSWAFYETNGVGLGGSLTEDGADGIQANMTNTMNTPIEEIERSFPIRIARYEFRADSCGLGMHRGGCGIVRSYASLVGGTVVTVMADREFHSPWGLAGGLPGGRTEVLLLRRGRRSRLRTKTTLSLRPGDVVEVRTAGGGGYGDPSNRSAVAARGDLRSGLLSGAESDSLQPKSAKTSGRVK